MFKFLGMVKRYLLVIATVLFLGGCEQIPFIKICGDSYWYSVPSGGASNYKEVKEQVKFVNGSCNNQYRWIKLAVSLFNSKNYDGVEKIVGMMLERRFNFFKNDQHRLTDGYTEFVEYIEGDEFKQTEPGKELAILLVEVEKRKHAARERIERKEEGVVPPDEMYKIKKDTCPYYCCLDKKFKARNDTILYKEINSDIEVGVVYKDDVVQNIYSESHAHPMPILIPFDCGYSRPVLRANDIVFVSKALGEGAYEIWHDGNIRSLFFSHFEDKQLFGEENTDCTGEYLIDEKVKRRTGTSWSQMKLIKKDGDELIGWSSKTYNFRNIYLCEVDPNEDKDVGRREEYKWIKKE